MEHSGELALVAHEIGGALTPTRHALDLLQSGTSGPLTADQARLLAIVTRGLQRAERVLQNVTAVAAPQSYRLRRQEIVVRELFEDLCSAFAGEARARGVLLQHEVDRKLAFPSDLFCLERVLANLVSNALKFTPAAGTVTLRAAPARSVVLPGRLTLLGGGFGCKPRFVAIEVEDSGVGLTEETRRRLFEPFYRGPEAQRCTAPGVGLGLTVARGLSERLHGQLRLTPSRQGAHFVLTLPGDAATSELAENVDAAIAVLGSRLVIGPQTIVVLRDAGWIGVAPEKFALEIERRMLEPGVAVLPLAANTWVVCAAAPVRVLVRALASAVEGLAGASARAALRVHVQQVARGAAGDPCLLQGVVRCRHPLPSSRPAREVLDGSDSRRR